jgi:AcrR family transcriptional regulator
MQWRCNAVRLHRVTRGVNADAAARRAEKIAATEERLVAAATRLFLRDGYLRTTLSAVAAEAGVADRTVYIRFATKAALLRRVMDVAVVGDTAPVELARRDWIRDTVTAPTLEGRIAAWARGAAQLMARLGPLLPVAEEASVVEPDVAAAWQAAREDTRSHVRRFWAAAARDGLLPKGSGVRWLTDTTVLLLSADAYLRGVQLLGWTPRSYQRWVSKTLTRIAAAA